MENMQLVQWDKIRTAIETAKDIKELTSLKDRLRAYQILAEQSKQSVEVQVKIAIYKARADRKCGEWLQENVKVGNPQLLEHQTIGLKDLGVTRFESHRLQKIASIPEEKFEEILQEAEVEVKKITSNMLVRLARATQKNERPDNEVILTEGKYRTIVIDPPWPVEKILRDVTPNQVEFDYPTMTIEKIKAINVQDIADEGCHLYLWTTQKFLPVSFEIMQVWGFDYIFTMVWHKNGGFQPFNLPQYNCEFVLFGRKGGLPFNETKNFFTCFNGKRREHSRKPSEFMDVVRRVSPEPRIELFSREKSDGFEQYGNETKRFSGKESVG